MAASALERTALGFLLFALAIVPLALGGVQPLALLGMRLLIIVAAGCWWTAVLLGLPLRLPRPTILTALLLYLGVVAVSALQSEYAFASLQGAVNIFIYAMGLLLSSALITSPRRRRAFLTVLLGTAALMGTYGVLQYAGWQWTPTHTPDRLSAFYYNSNHYSGYLALMAPVAGALSLQRGPAPALRMCSGVLFLVLMFNLALTFSWGLLATSAALAGMMLTGAIRRARTKQLLATIGLTVVLGFASLGTLLAWAPQLDDGSPAERASEFFDAWVARSVRGRLAIAGAAARVARDNPVLGVGPGNLIYAIAEYRAPQVRDDVTNTLHMFVNYAHNDYLQVASETGVMGLLAFVAVFVVAITSALIRPASGIHSGMTWGLVALMLHGLTDGNMTVIPANALWAFAFAGALTGQRSPCHRP